MSSGIYTALKRIKPLFKNIVKCLKHNVKQKELDSKKMLMYDPIYVKFNK